MEGISEIDQQIETAERELAELDKRRAAVLEQIKALRQHKNRISSEASPEYSTVNDRTFVTNQSSQSEKISLFRTLFRGREDVYPRRFESKKTDKSGYQPACHNEWLRGVCGKPRIGCGNCENRKFIPVSDEVIRNHLLGCDPKEKTKRGFTIGVYPLLPDETCLFISADFDQSAWMEDVSQFLETCKQFDIPAAVERSRSGNGGHVWVFFSEPIPAVLARKMFSFILTETMERHPEIGLRSYDRLAPLVRNVIVLKGGMGDKERRSISAELAGISDGDQRIIVATGRYLGEGFDDARLDTLVLTLPVSWRGILAQYAGRLHRIHQAKKEVIIYDYADLDVSMLSNMFERRRVGYRAIGYEIDK